MKKILSFCAAVAATIAFAEPAKGVHIALELPPGPNNPRNSEGAFMPPSFLTMISSFVVQVLPLSEE